MSAPSLHRESTDSLIFVIKTMLKSELYSFYIEHKNHAIPTQYVQHNIEIYSTLIGCMQTI